MGRRSRFETEGLKAKACGVLLSAAMLLRGKVPVRDGRRRTQYSFSFRGRGLWIRGRRRNGRVQLINA